MASVWLQQTDLENAATARTVAICCSDDGGAIASPTIVNDIIARAEAEVLSWIVPEYGPPPFTPGLLAQFGGDQYFKNRALDFAILYMYERHPEGVPAERQNDLSERNKRVVAAAQRMLESVQRPQIPTPPANVGGAYVDGANRMYIPSPDGTSNSGDY